MKKILTIIFVVLILSLITLSILVYKNKDQSYKDFENLTLEELDNIIIQCRDKLDENSEDINSYIKMGIAHFRKGKEHYENAINEFHKARMLGAIDLRIPYYSGIIYEETGFDEDAIGEYKKFLRNMPDNLDIRLMLGNIYFKKSMYDSAIDEYESAYSYHPKNVTVICNLAIAYKKKGLTDEAIEKFEYAVKLKKFKKNLPPGIYENLAQLYEMKGDSDKAKEYYQLSETYREEKRK